MTFFQNIKQKAKKLKQEVIIISLALGDKRTPFYARILILLTISYALSPIDLIPDFIPVLGYLDDLIILPAMLILSLKMIPDDVLNDCRSKVTQDSKVQMKSGKYAAAVIVLIWISIAVLIIFSIVK